MSYAAIEWCRPLEITGWPKAVLVCLSDHHNDKTGRCDPSLITIAKETGCSDQTARRALRWLSSTGFIRCEKRKGRPDLISLNFEANPYHPDTPITQIPLSGSHKPLTPRQSTPDSLIATPDTVIPKPEEPESKPEGTVTHAEQTNGHNGATLGLGLIPAEHLAGDGQDRCACDHAKDAWNVVAERCGWPRIQRFTPPRAKATEARLAEIGGLEGWNLMLGKMEASPFFRRRWQPSFDWILKPANLMKVMEGNYDERAGDTGLLATLAALGEPGT